MTAKKHYDNLLGEVYSWTLGDFNARVTEQLDVFKRHKIFPQDNGLALDLGSGNGLQSVALARLGFKVNAVDFNRHLLNELESNKGDLPISITESDILSFLEKDRQQVELAICMGDTLTHLADWKEVDEMIRSTAAKIAKGGRLIFSWRDLTEERKNTARFIHVRSDENRSMSCFLEYFPEHVVVYDIVIEKVNGAWTQRISHYPKLRLSSQEIFRALSREALTVMQQEVSRGMTIVIAGKF